MAYRVAVRSGNEGPKSSYNLLSLNKKQTLWLIKCC